MDGWKFEFNECLNVIFLESGTFTTSFWFSDYLDRRIIDSRTHKYFLKSSALFASSPFPLEVEEATKIDVWEGKEEAEEAEERLKSQEATALVAAGVGVGVGAGANERKHK